MEGNITAERYVKYFVGEAYNAEKLRIALEVYNRSRLLYDCSRSDQIPKNKTDRFLWEHRKELWSKSKEGSGLYEMDCYKANKLFCQEQIEAAAVELDKVLYIIKDNISYKHFSQGLSKISATSAAKGVAVADAFYDGDPVIRKLIFDYVVDDLVYKKSNGWSRFWSDISSMAIKAVHFEQYGVNGEDYETVGDEEYRNFVSCVAYYKNTIDDHPFDTEEYVEKFVAEIKKERTFFVETLSKFGGDDYSRLGAINDYFCDAVCNYVWKEIAKENWVNEDGENISKSTEYQDVFNIICTYLQR